MDTSHLRKNIFTHKQDPSFLTHRLSLLPAWTLAKRSIARGQYALFPFLSLISFPPLLLLSHVLAVESSSPPLHLPPSPLSSFLTPHSSLQSSSSVFSSVPQLRSDELAAAQCDVDSEVSCGVELSQNTQFDPLPRLSEQLSLHNGQFLHTCVCVSVW